MDEKIMPARGQIAFSHSKSKQSVCPAFRLPLLPPPTTTWPQFRATADYTAGPGLGRGHHAAKGATYTHSVDFRRSLSGNDSAALLHLRPGHVTKCYWNVQPSLRRVPSEMEPEFRRHVRSDRHDYTRRCQKPWPRDGRGHAGEARSSSPLDAELLGAARDHVEVVARALRCDCCSTNW